MRTKRKGHRVDVDLRCCGCSTGPLDMGWGGIEASQAGLVSRYIYFI